MAIPDGMSGWLLKRALGTRYIVYTYGKEILRSWSTEAERRGFRWALESADRVVTISQYTKEKLVELKVDPSNVEIVYPGVDSAMFRPDPAMRRRIRARHGIADYQRVLLTVARLTPGEGATLRKGHDKVIEALPEIVARVPDVVYLIVGTGPAEGQLRARSQERGVADQVIFAGYVPDEDLPAYYNAADVFIMPNREEGINVEGFGIVFLEANACGKPVIGGRSGGTVDAIADGESGYLVDPYDPSDIAESAIRLLTDPALAKHMGKVGRRRALETFSWERAARQVNALTNDVASASGDRRTSLVHPVRLARSCRFFLRRL
jgi:phosphatidylinositol alpha-1,6-mannosyltransferase